MRLQVVGVHLTDNAAILTCKAIGGNQTFDLLANVFKRIVNGFVIEGECPLNAFQTVIHMPNAIVRCLFQ